MPANTRRLAATLSLTLLAITSTGCIAWEIRDEMRQINASMEDVKVQLGTVNDGLTKLERTNTILSDLDMKLTSLETINSSLSSVDAHLASLRKTLNNIDSTIPFLSLSGDEEDEVIETAEEAAEREGGAPSSQPETQPGADPAEEPATEPQTPAADPG
ncbi:MAG: hypothetical protein HRU13_05080 [Phycisphaerales bacterium]|nr:hypothetical protein [Phycisphaerales bacterium]